MSDLKRKGLAALLWEVLGKFSGQSVSFVVTLVLARLLEPEDFGLIALVMVVVGIAEIFSDAGLGSALIQRRHVRPVHFSSVFYFNVTAGLFLTLVTVAAAPWIARFYGAESLSPLLQAAAPLFIVQSLATTQRVRLRKGLRYRLIAVSDFSGALAGGGAGIALAYMGYGPWALVAQVMVTSLVAALALWTGSDWRPRRAFSVKALRQLWGFGGRMFLAGLIDRVYTRLDYVVIGRLFPMDVLGFFQRAKAVTLLANNYMAGSLISVLFPVLSTVQRSPQRFRDIVEKMLGLVAFVSFAAFSLIHIFAAEVIRILYSAKWLPAADYLALLALSALLFPVNAVLVSVLSSRGRSRAFLRLDVYKKIFGLGNLLLGFHFGIRGYLMGLIIVSVIATLINGAAATRELGGSLWGLLSPVLELALYALAAIGAVRLFVYLSPAHAPWVLAGKLLVLAGVYLLLNALFKTRAFFTARQELLALWGKGWGIRA